MTYSKALFCMLMLLLQPWTATAEKLPVFVSIQPQRYIVEEIGGDRVTVEVMVAPGANPETYEPKPRQMAALAQARLYFAIGVPFERFWLPKISAPRLVVVNTDRGIAKLSMAEHAHPFPPQDAAAGDAHGEPDPHIWLAPPLVKIMAQHTAAALETADPAGSDFYRRNYYRFSRQLDALHTEIQTLLAPAEGRRFMVYHPAWGYFAQAYGLEQVPIELHGREPSPESLRTQIEEGRRLGVQIIFVQPQFSTKSARLVADAIGARVVSADPLSGDWAANLRSVAAAIHAALR